MNFSIVNPSFPQKHRTLEFLDRQLGQPLIARPAHALPGRGVVAGAVYRAYQNKSLTIEELARTPVKFIRYVHATIDIGMYFTHKAHHESGFSMSTMMNFKAHAIAAFKQLSTTTDQAF